MTSSSPGATPRGFISASSSRERTGLGSRRRTRKWIFPAMGPSAGLRHAAEQRVKNRIQDNFGINQTQF